MDAFEAKQVTILGISFDDQDANRRFAEKFAFPFRLLCDVTREVGLAYGAVLPGEDRSPRRITYLIDPEGQIARAWMKVTPQTHPEEVLAAIDELESG